MPVSVDPFKEIFGGDDVLLLPGLVELRPDDLQIIFKFYVVFLIFKQEPHENQFLVEIFSRLQNFNASSFLGFQVLHIENVGDERIGDLPGGIDFYEIGDVIVDRRKKLVLNGGLILLESFAWN